MLVCMLADPDATGHYAINNEPEGEVVALNGPGDECPYYKNGYWRGTDGHGVVIGQRFGVLTGRYLVNWCNNDDDLPEWVRFALIEYRSNYGYTPVSFPSGQRSLCKRSHE